VEGGSRTRFDAAVGSVRKGAQVRPQNLGCPRPETLTWALRGNRRKVQDIRGTSHKKKTPGQGYGALGLEKGHDGRGLRIVRLKGSGLRRTRKSKEGDYGERKNDTWSVTTQPGGAKENNRELVTYNLGPMRKTSFIKGEVSQKNSRGTRGRRATG